MSASLVGSEMCIRDRSPRTSGCRRTDASPPEPPPSHRQLMSGNSHLAVSYTHLTLPTICSV
eukprot:5927822-Alexandrium_andersonii.AAC.1